MDENSTIETTNTSSEQAIFFRDMYIIRLVTISIFLLTSVMYVFWWFVLLMNSPFFCVFGREMNFGF